MEAQRLEERTMYDLEMIEQMGYCNGIENYSRHLSGRSPGEAPPCLLDYFPRDLLVFIDESHQTVPQIGGMYRGDRARKETWLISASGCPRRSTTARCALANSKPWLSKPSTSPPRPRTTS